MALETFIEDTATAGGTWVKLEHKGDSFEGVLLDVQVRNRTTPQGDVVLSRKTQQPRKVYIVVYKVDPDPSIEGDEGIRKYQANEAAQAALKEAHRASGGFKAGGRIKLGVKAEKADEYSQHEYQCRFEPPAPGADVFADGDDEEPF